jgi:hypothetical protein
METTTETNQDHRELTKTEIAITVAQIEDRLIRWINARADLCSSWELDDGDPQQAKALEHDFLNEKPFRDKYSIPYGVCLFPIEGVDSRDVETFMKFAEWWASGKMTDKIFDLFNFHFCEIVEVDFYWVLMDQPGFYYKDQWRNPSDHDYSTMEAELKQIGTRSKKKAKMKFKLQIGHGSSES